MKSIIVFLMLATPLHAQVIRQSSPNGITLSSASSTFVIKAGDTMTGALAGTSASYTGNVTALNMTATGAATGTALQLRGGLKQYAQNALDNAGTWNNSPCHSILADSSTDYCYYDVAVGISAVRLYQGASGRVSLHGSTLNALASGSVGIGTIAPAAALDVNGNAQFGSGAEKSTFTATGFWEPYSRTRAQIDTLVPTKVGQVIYASDTTLPGLCVSTGTAAAQWRKMESAALGCGTNN